MLRLIAHREFTEFCRDGRLFWTGGIILVLLFTALAVNWQYQRTADAERVAAQTLDYDDWVNQKERHPHDAAHQGMHVFKPQSALSMLDPGIMPYVGSTLWLQAHRQSEVKFRPAQDATGLQRFGNLSPAWVIQMLGPLLVIILGFNAFAGEREQGTLRQTLSLGVSPYKLLWGKALALAIGLGLLLLPTLLFAMGMIIFTMSGSAMVDALWRILWLGLGYSVYLGIAIFVVLAVSAKTATSRMALAILLGLWIVTTMIAPRAISDASRIWHPSPTRYEFTANLDEDLGNETRKAWMENFGSDQRWGSEVGIDQWGKALEIDDKAGYKALDRQFHKLWDTFDSQQRVQEWAGFVVPLLAIRSFSMGLAGTDFANHRDFSVAAENHRRIMQDKVSHDLVEHADGHGDHHFDYKSTREFWATFPKFEYALPDRKFALAHNTLSLAILVFVLLAVMVFAHRAVMPRKA